MGQAVGTGTQMMGCRVRAKGQQPGCGGMLGKDGSLRQTPNPKDSKPLRGPGDQE